ncbi:Enoyl-CoA hydratase/isomerase [Burkholderia sp. H160]|nr:Enoyl-CoA hydratase/isomerase [Burkholderia sp. H160]
MEQTLAEESFETIVYERRNAVASITLNRPNVLNALNKKAIRELRTAFECARDDAQVCGVIVTGAGDRAFIAGADISELAAATPVEAVQAARAGFAPAPRTRRKAPKPSWKNGVRSSQVDKARFSIPLSQHAPGAHAAGGGLLKIMEVIR